MSDFESKFDDFVEEKDNLKTRQEQEKEDKKNLTKEDKEEEKEKKKKLSTPFVAYKIVKENAKNPEKINEKFELFTTNLSDLYTNEVSELTDDNIFKKMMTDFIE